MVAILRSILGVVVGIVVGVLVVGVLEFAGHLIFPPPPGMDPMNHESIKEHLHDLPLGAFVSVLVAWSGGILLGSWLAALIAGRGAYLHAGLVGLVFCAFSMATMAMIPHPIWFMAVACAALPLATVGGGFLGKLESPEKASLVLHVALSDTIAAIASAPGGAARGIIRMSGPDSIACLSRCFFPDDESSLDNIRQPQVVPGNLLLESGSRLLGDVNLWPTRRSYTREPAAEFHTLGSPPLLAAALRVICSAGARLAEPGEFSLRAFLAGRLDLTQAEAVLGVIDAAGQSELKTALAQLAGGLAAPLGELRGNLLDLLAHLEAGLDFAEEDIELISRDELNAALTSAAGQTAGLAERMTTRGTSEAEIRVVLVGWPNVGKSSLLNALAGTSAAIVSPQAGTTRDFVAWRANLDGLACLLIDTAGVEQDRAEESISAAAQEIMGRQVSESHVTILCLDSTRALNMWERQILSENETSRRLVALTKCDEPCETDCAGPAIATSSRTGLGLSILAKAIRERVSSSAANDSQVVAGTSDRCRESLRLAAESLSRASETARASQGEELVAAEIRIALDELGKVAGAVYTDDVLDRIFSRFCIGK